MNAPGMQVVCRSLQLPRTRTRQQHGNGTIQTMRTIMQPSAT